MKLNAKMRSALKPSTFALPAKKAFPLNDESHGRAALSDLHNASPADQATIKAKVASKFPDIKQAGKRMIQKRGQ